MPFAKRALAASLQVLGSQGATVWPGHLEYPLGLLDGTDGFRVTAEFSTGRLGYSVSGVGDVNNDGFNDVILGESPELATSTGAAYVVFGSESFSSLTLDISALDGKNGFKIEGTNIGDFAGTAVAGAGDVNGDGYDDIMVGAWGASSAAGEILVVFGAAIFPAVVGIADLDGSAGFVMVGSTTSDAAGFSLASAGDVNNDGAADMIIGAFQADPAGSMSGRVYVVFGSLAWTESIVQLGELASRGLTLEGAERRDYAGHSVAGAGDVNDDGYSDVIISAYGATEVYVFYGAASFLSNVYSLKTLSGTDGFTISAGNDGDEIIVAGVGDLNNDYYGDIAIGHSLADLGSAGNSAGATYVIFGGGSIPARLNMLTDLDGSNGFVLEGGSEGDRSGASVSGAWDINQDGYDDIVIGAPGVENEAGSAYVVFGRAVFEASYTLGAIGPEESYRLIAPSNNGVGGISVAGAGDINQDGFPDLVVGAYGSGTAGEAFVVLPGLTGTPPPTIAPTPTPTGPTPTPHSGEATPMPTVNFLVEGIVGAGTIYESPEVFVQARELGGEVLLGADRWFDEDTRVAMALEGLHETNTEGSLVGLSATVPHVVNGGGLVFEATPTVNVTVEGIAAREATMTTSALGGEVSITITIQAFEEDGVVTSGDEQIEVSPGTLKVSLSVSDWPFCDPLTAPRRSTQEPPPTVCPAGGAESLTLETGAFLDVTIAVKGPSSSTPILSTTTQGDPGGRVGLEKNGRAGVEYSMSGGSAEATLVMSEWVNTDDNGWTKSDEVSLSGTTFTVRFPASSGTLLYDPTLELALVALVDADDGDELWRHRWFVATLASVGVLLAIGLLGCALSCNRRADKDKVSPGFEAVAPAVGTGSSEGIRQSGRPLSRFLAKNLPCYRLWRERAGRMVAQSASSTAGGKRYNLNIRWRRKGASSVANHASAGAANNSGGGSPRTAAPSSGGGAANAAPDWIQGLSGGGDSAKPEGATANVAVPDWLADAAGAAGVKSGENSAGAGHEDVYYYGQGYEGYEGYHGYEGYEGYQGYAGYEEYGHGCGDGYGDGHGVEYANSGYVGGVRAQGVGTGTPVATPSPAAGPAVVSGAYGGGGSSWLTNAASTVNRVNNREEEEEAP